MNERYKELIKYQTEIVRVLFLIFFAVATGIISIIKKIHLTTYDWMFLLTGLLIIFAVLIVIIKLDRKIRLEINKIQ